MSVRSSAPFGIEVPERSGTGFSNGGLPSSAPSPIVEQFYERYQSFKANKAPAIDIEEIRNVFDFFDENHDGLISKDDLQQFMGRLGFLNTEEEIMSMVSSVDLNQDGNVDFNEFASLYQTFASDETQRGVDGDDHENDLKEVFHVFDKNADGMISASELQEVLLNLGMHEGQSLSNCVRMIQSVDVDGNGSVDFGEFKKMMSSDFGRG